MARKAIATRVHFGGKGLDDGSLERMRDHLVWDCAWAQACGDYAGLERLSVQLRYIQNEIAKNRQEGRLRRCIYSYMR